MIKAVDYEFKRGDTTNLDKFKILDTNGNVLSLGQSDKLYFTLKRSTKIKTFLLQKTINNGITLKSDGYYHITMESADTSNLDYGTYQYDIELKSGDFVRTLIEGTITLLDEVTWGGNEQ